MGNQIYTSGETLSIISKLSQDGDVMWSNQLASWGETAIHDVAVDGQGNCIMTGHFTSNISVGGQSLTGSSFENTFISKILSDGAIAWINGTSDADMSRGLSVTVDQSDNYFITGYFSGNGNFNTVSLASLEFTPDVFLAKYSTDGIVQSVKLGGGNDTDFGNSIAIAPNGDCFIGGYFKSVTAAFGSTLLFRHAEENAFVWRVKP